MARQVAASELATMLAMRFLRPEACREAAARLPGRPSPDEVGACEMAFARAAVVRHVVTDVLPPTLAAPVNVEIAREIERAFAGAHTLATRERYGEASLPQVSAEALAIYEPAAFFARRLAEAVMARVGVAGRPPADLIDGFGKLTEAVVLTLARAKVV